MTRQNSARGAPASIALTALAAALLAVAAPSATQAQSASPTTATFIKSANNAADRVSANVARAESVSVASDTSKVEMADAATASAPTSPVGTPTKRQAKESPLLSFDREVYNYTAEGRRDPFQSLMSTGELRPLITDLRLVGIAYDAGGNSVAVLRDLGTNEQYRVRAGEQLGRMRVAAIQPKKVVFTIEEFGFSRQESLALGDLTNARTQQ